MPAVGAALFLDLDGTMYRGHTALRAYAQAMAARAGGRRGEALAAKAEAFLRDPRPFVPFRDSWAALSAFGGEAGLDWPRRDEAFLEVREAIMAGVIPVEPAPGLVEFLEGLDPRVRVAVLTNSDGPSAARLLEFLGLGALCAHLKGGARKPSGFGIAVRDHLVGIDPGRAVSVGDNHANDVVPARAMGMTTVHVRWPGAEGGQADLSVERLEQAFPFVKACLGACLEGAGGTTVDEGAAEGGAWAQEGGGRL
jgi:FMN phosphatase YigB (HAD superfamily)